MHIALFNTEYMRQFEIVISSKKWNSLVNRYGTADAIAVAFIQNASIQSAGSTGRAKTYRGFIRYTFETGEWAAEVRGTRTQAISKGEYVIGRRAGKRTMKDLRRMNLQSADKATRRASRKRYMTIQELEDKYGKSYSSEEVKKRERNRW